MTHQTLQASVGEGSRDAHGELLLRCARGDQAAFASLYDATVRRVYGLSLRVLHDETQAQEVTHESFMDVWRWASRYDSSQGSVDGWICAIAHRKAVSRARAGEPTSRSGTGDVGVPDAEAENVAAAVRPWTPVQRQVIELAYFDGLTATAVATALGIPVRTATTRMRDGLMSLNREKSAHTHCIGGTPRRRRTGDTVGA